jgi:hypothetical protein
VVILEHAWRMCYTWGMPGGCALWLYLGHAWRMCSVVILGGCLEDVLCGYTWGMPGGCALSSGCGDHMGRGVSGPASELMVPFAQRGEGGAIAVQ